MSKGKKINPRRRPATMADVKKAKKEAESNALDMSIAIILLSLLDAGFLTPDTMRPAWDAINYKSESVIKGYCKPHDMFQTLAEEYDVYVGPLAEKLQEERRTHSNA